MAKMTKKNSNNTPEELLNAIKKSDVWLLITINEDEDGNGAEVAIRESYKTCTINMIAMLLEQKEIYDAVQAKMAMVKMLDKKKRNNPPDLNVN